ncbi:MAG TPA: GNAT family N-acetyltransferase [Bryobacteraceae bacterium]|nr:GNAT family N-acetyltransferase [Bryobacteraceae bacterium]
MSIQTVEIAGYYTLSATGIALDQLPAEVVRKLPRYPVVPAALLGRLAVAQRWQGKGLGAALLADAITRATRAELGVFAIIVDAKDDAAEHFYEHHGFRLLTGERRRSFLPAATALRALDRRSPD